MAKNLAFFSLVIMRNKCYTAVEVGPANSRSPDPGTPPATIDEGDYLTVALKIRLRRVGAKKQPAYRVVIADSRAPRDGRFIEIIGAYNPLTHPSTVSIDSERAIYWMRNGAQPTDVVKRLFVKDGTWSLFTGEPMPESLAQPEMVTAEEPAAPEEAISVAVEAPIVTEDPVPAVEKTPVSVEESAFIVEDTPASVAETAPAVEETPVE
jgi:small subunit ribosomal protein S16